MTSDGGASPDEGTGSDEPVIPPQEAVVPPPPPETPIPDGLLAPPPADIPPADAVIPPPPPEARLRSDRTRPTPAILEGEQPAAVADDWSQRSIAPEVPATGTYRGLAVVIFGFLILLLVAAIVTGVVLLTSPGGLLAADGSTAQYAHFLV